MLARCFNWHHWYCNHSLVIVLMELVTTHSNLNWTTVKFHLSSVSQAFNWLLGPTMLLYTIKKLSCTRCSEFSLFHVYILHFKKHGLCCRDASVPKSCSPHYLDFFLSAPMLLELKIDLQNMLLPFLSIRKKHKSIDMIKW